MPWRFFIALVITGLTTTAITAEENQPKIVIDILEKPKVTICAKGHKRSYPESPNMQRLIWEPWAKFHYRIKETHLVTGEDAIALITFVRGQIADKSPTGWCGHEADYAITVFRGEEVTLRATLSSESGSCVYVDADKTVIGHFHPTRRILALLTNKPPGEQGVGGNPLPRSESEIEP